jgi:sulfur-carrier protein
VSVSFYLTPALRAFADGRERIEIGGSPATLGDALEALWTLCPGLRHRVATEQGEIREHVNVFVGQENVRYTGGLATSLPSAAEISIFHAVSGGAEPAMSRSTSPTRRAPSNSSAGAVTPHGALQPDPSAPRVR